MLENATVSLWKPWGTMPFRQNCREVATHKNGGKEPEEGPEPDAQTQS
jgi:hypothetical protein